MSFKAVGNLHRRTSPDDFIIKPYVSYIVNKNDSDQTEATTTVTDSFTATTAYTTTTTVVTSVGPSGRKKRS